MKYKARFFLLYTLLLLILTACTSEVVPTEPTEVSIPTQIETVPETTAATVPETEPPIITAEQIKEGCTFLLGSQDVTEALSDGSYATTVSLSGALCIESSQSFASLYIQWDSLPGAYTVSWDTGSLVWGADGFLHDYIPLPCSVTRVWLTPADTASVCGISLFTEGSAPEGVQVWLPPAETADILVFPTHSDDDVLFFGAVMSYYAIDTDYTVQTAFLVDHVYEPVRNHERLDGLWELGIRHYPVLNDARDYYSTDLYKAMANYYSDDILGWQVSLLRRFRPLVVLGHDLKGEYGHGAHQLNSHYLTQAVALAADPGEYPQSAQQYGTWDTPKLYLHLYAENEILFDVNTPLENDPQGRTPFAVAEAAFACHESQQKTPFRVSQGESESLDCRRFGLYRSLVGADTAGDLMEHVVGHRK